MTEIYDTKAPKKSTNVSINSELLEKARDMKINLSSTLERALAEKVREAQRVLWKQENAKAIEAYNQFAERHGTFSDSVRKF